MLYAFKNLALRFSSLKVPVVDVQPFLNNPTSAQAECKVVAEALHKYGCLVIKDPRVHQSENSRFIDQMEKYFESRGKLFYDGKPVKEIFPEKNYQVGATPEYVEHCRDHKDILESYKGENKAYTPSPPPKDAKWRYFWDIHSGDNIETLYDNPAPEDFPQFK